MALAGARCRYPLGSGGKRVTTLPPKRPARLCSSTISRTKFEGRPCSLIGPIVSSPAARELPELTASPTVDTVAPLEARQDGCLALRVNVAANFLLKEDCHDARSVRRAGRERDVTTEGPQG